VARGGFMVRLAAAAADLRTRFAGGDAAPAS
jgi:hypothetical protein